MALVQLSNVSHHYGGPTLLQGVTLQLDPGHKIGLIGQNGTGKSTLLKMIAGEFEPTEGRVIRQRGISIAYQAQELRFAPGSTVFDEMRRLFTADLQRQQQLHDLEEALGSAPEAERPALLARYERLQHEHESRQGYDVDRRIETVLSGLGLPERSWSQPIESFSGGERNIIGLARIVLMEPDLMLLDEPSNHLDMEGIEWFIGFLRRSPASVLMVSHNRHLLDATVDEVWELASRRVVRWAGNYSDFQRQKAEAIALQERQYRSQQRLIKRIQFQARRLMDMANAYDDPGQAKRAKAMLKRIEQMDRVEAPNTGDHRFHASLAGASRHGHIALEIRGMNIAVESAQGGPPRTLLDNATLNIEFGQRVALVGPNGSGKTTLFRAIQQHASWENPDLDLHEGPFHLKGRLRVGKGVVVGDYSQIHDHKLPGEATLIAWAMETTGLRYQPATELLHRFLFTRDDLERPIRTLSGGEKSRLQLARLSSNKANLLMLDEPTNHLDIQACEQLEEMLEDFDGTLLVISHDRYFLDKLVNRVIELRDRALVPFVGSFAEWWAQKHAQVLEGPRKTLQLHSQKAAAEHDLSDGAREREDKKARQREQHRLRTQLKAVEARIEKLELRQRELETRLAALYASAGDKTELPSLTRDFDDARAELATLYTQWEQLGAALE
ncbi:MAG: ABC-F family ATP-binding cassette domain-containing protein [Planctomycetes bacterium]|nr:ABC-F family ATP-binding cassette domain-containing protein [Planctomycetota bacterium]